MTCVWVWCVLGGVGVWLGPGSRRVGLFLSVLS